MIAGATTKRRENMIAAMTAIHPAATTMVIMAKMVKRNRRVKNYRDTAAVVASERHQAVVIVQVIPALILNHQAKNGNKTTTAIRQMIGRSSHTTRKSRKNVASAVAIPRRRVARARIRIQTRRRHRRQPHHHHRHRPAAVVRAAVKIAAPTRNQTHRESTRSTTSNGESERHRMHTETTHTEVEIKLEICFE